MKSTAYRPSPTLWGATPAVCQYTARGYVAFDHRGNRIGFFETAAGAAVRYAALD
jgi:hypothetical protein